MAGRVFAHKMNIGDVRVVTAAGAIVMLNEGVLHVNKTVGAATTVTMQADPIAGDFVFIKDKKGDAGTNNIVITPAQAKTIDGAASYTISQNFGSVLLNYDGSQWTVVSAANSNASVASQTITALTVTKETITPGASTAAAGTTTADAGALPAGTSSVYPTTGADDTKGVVINAADKVTGRVLFIGNGVSNKILKVYPAAGGTINGAAADAAFSSASGKGVIAFCLLGSANTWLAW